jgi:hypothetical protein
MSRLKVDNIETRSGNNVAMDNALQLKSYTTAERDALSSSQAGDTIYNTTTGKVEYYDGSSWVETGATTFNCDFLVIAGGGGGSNGDTTAQGGGGGAGGYRNSYNNETSGGNSTSESAFRVVKGLTYEINVGGGGSVATVGNDSYAFTTLRSTGGGNGGQMNVDSRRGQSGGSGGGAGSVGSIIYGSSGSGSKYQGFRGGDYRSTSPYEAGGGGGAGGIGGDANNTGGAGLASSITGSSVTRAAGGNGGTSGGSAPSVNTGDGGEGRRSSSGATAGASGVVILRWATADATIGATRTGLTDGGVQTAGSDSYIVFTGGTGTITFS